MVTKRTLAGFDALAVTASASFAAAYSAVMVSGLAGVPAENIVTALHDRAPQVALIVLLCAALARLLLLERSERRPATLLLWLGVLLMASGLVASSYVRFEGRILLTEGQQFSGADEEYAEGSVVRAKRAAVPRFAMAAREVAPRLSKSGLIAERIVLHASYQHAGGQRREVEIGSLLPTFLDGMFLRARRFGYAPLFRITGNAGEVLEESFFSLAVFPPGAEDSIRLMHTPHTYYVQYYPQGTGPAADAAAGVPAAGDPVFRLRVARNLALLYNGTMRLREKVLIESTSVSFEQVRKWAELSVVRDHGIVLFSAGAFLSATAMLVRRVRRKGVADAVQGRQEGAGP